MIRFYLKERMLDMEFRNKKRMTLDEVARNTGVSKNTLNRIANSRGDYNTTTDTLDRLCKYFDCSLKDLADYVEDE